VKGEELARVKDSRVTNDGEIVHNRK
jgi:hypothetical protein